MEIMLKWKGDQKHRSVTMKKGAYTYEKESIINDIHFIYVNHCSCMFTAKRKNSGDSTNS